MSPIQVVTAHGIPAFLYENLSFLHSLPPQLGSQDEVTQVMAALESTAVVKTGDLI